MDLSIEFVVTIIAIVGGVLLYYFTNNNAADTRITRIEKTQSAIEDEQDTKDRIAKIEVRIENIAQECGTCRKNFNEKIEIVEKNYSRQIETLNQNINRMEASLKSDIKDLRDTIIRVLTKQ